MQNVRGGDLGLDKERKFVWFLRCSSWCCFSSSVFLVDYKPLATCLNLKKKREALAYDIRLESFHKSLLRIS